MFFSARAANLSFLSSGVVRLTVLAIRSNRVASHCSGFVSINRPLSPGVSGLANVAGSVVEGRNVYRSVITGSLERELDGSALVITRGYRFSLLFICSLLTHRFPSRTGSVMSGLG